LEGRKGKKRKKKKARRPSLTFLHTPIIRMPAAKGVKTARKNEEKKGKGGGEERGSRHSNFVESLLSRLIAIGTWRKERGKKGPSKNRSPRKEEKKKGKEKDPRRHSHTSTSPLHASTGKRKKPKRKKEKGPSTSTLNPLRPTEN